MEIAFEAIDTLADALELGGDAHERGVDRGHPEPLCVPARVTAHAGSEHPCASTGDRVSAAGREHRFVQPVKVPVCRDAGKTWGSKPGHFRQSASCAAVTP